MFDTIKPGTPAPSKSQHIKNQPSVSNPEDAYEPSESMYNLTLESEFSGPKPVANSTVRRTRGTVARTPSKRSTRRRSSSVKQPLGLDMTFGNSPSTVRQFRRVSDRQNSLDGNSGYVPGMNENSMPKTLFNEPNTKEAILGRRMYNSGIGLTCQEVLANTSDQEKREAISRLAEAFSDLEMIDPEGLYHIVKSSFEKLQA